MDFFITGFPRSGTTWLTNIMNTELECAIPPETRFYEEVGVFDNLSGLSVKKRLSLSQRLSDLIELDELNDIFDDSVTYNSEESLNKIIEFWAKKNEIEYKKIGEKSPVHQLHINTILERIPDAKVVFIVRDPRFVVNSVIKAGWGLTNPYKIAGMYIYRHNLTKRKIDRDGRILTVTYEDLVADTPKELAKISSFVGLIPRGEKNERFMKLASPEWESRWKAGSQGSVKDGNAAPSAMGSFQRNVCEFMLEPTLRDLGYSADVKASFKVKLTSFVCKVLYVSRYYIFDRVKSLLELIFPIRRFLGNRVVSGLKNDNS